MTGPAHRYRFHYAATPVGITDACGRTPISRANLHAKNWRLRTLTTPAAPPGPWAQDLWDVAVGAHIADRLAPRSPADDGWTRLIDIDLPVSDPDRWTQKAREILTNLLEVSTGDRWTLNFRQYRHAEPFANPRIDDGDETPAADAGHPPAPGHGGAQAANAPCAGHSGPGSAFVTITTPGRSTAPQDRPHCPG